MAALSRSQIDQFLTAVGQRCEPGTKLYLLGGVRPTIDLDYVFDPYTIALSKLERGFDTDIEDILFLVQHELIIVETLVDIVETAVIQATQFDLDPTAMRQRLQIVRESV